MYSDAVEITSPLAAGKGRHKILQLVWTVGSLKKKFRSQIDTINVSVIVQDFVMKKYGYKVVYRKLIEEMKRLERGIIVEMPFRRTIKIAFPMHLGDNLEQHSLAHLSLCFSSNDICRKKPRATSLILTRIFYFFLLQINV